MPRLSVSAAQEQPIREFRNVADDSGCDEALVTRLFGAPTADGLLVFGKKEAERSRDVRMINAD